MMISENTQLGLRYKNEDVKVELMKTMMLFLDKRISSFNGAIELMRHINASGKLKDGIISSEDMKSISNEVSEKLSDDWIINTATDKNELIKLIERITLYIEDYPLIKDMVSDEDSKYYFICDSVYKAAELIKIGENFSSRTIKDIRFGKYTYLMGKHCMVRFIVVPKAIKGLYWNDAEKNAFEFGLDIDTGEYYFPDDCGKEFSKLMQVMAFVELGDIEIITLGKNRNNGGKKGIDKIHNASNNTVYVVDSTWNKIIIRTDGFAVRGHFRLQPCGVNHADRKLMWIDAFEKHGYTRRPKAEIVR